MKQEVRQWQGAALCAWEILGIGHFLPHSQFAVRSFVGPRHVSARTGFRLFGIETAGRRIVFSVRKRLAHFLELRRGCFALHNSKKDPMSSPLIQGHSWTVAGKLLGCSRLKTPRSWIIGQTLSCPRPTTKENSDNVGNEGRRQAE